MTRLVVKYCNSKIRLPIHFCCHLPCSQMRIYQNNCSRIIYPDVLVLFHGQETEGKREGDSLFSDWERRMHCWLTLPAYQKPYCSPTASWYCRQWRWAAWPDSRWVSVHLEIFCCDHCLLWALEWSGSLTVSQLPFLLPYGDDTKPCLLSAAVSYFCHFMAFP